MVLDDSLYMVVLWLDATLLWLHGLAHTVFCSCVLKTRTSVLNIRTTVLNVCTSVLSMRARVISFCTRVICNVQKQILNMVSHRVHCSRQIVHRLWKRGDTLFQKQMPRTHAHLQARFAQPPRLLRTKAVKTEKSAQEAWNEHKCMMMQSDTRRKRQFAIVTNEEIQGEGPYNEGQAETFKKEHKW